MEISLDGPGAFKREVNRTFYGDEYVFFNLYHHNYLYLQIINNYTIFFYKLV